MLRHMKGPPLATQLVLCLACSLLLIVSFPWADCWFLAWFAFVPLLLALEASSCRRAFLLSYLTGLVFWLGTIYWLAYITTAGMIILVMYLALYFGIFGALIVQASARPSCQLFLIPVFWVLLEFVRSYFLTGFGWALLGYSQYRVTLLLQIAELTGVWGVSFLVMAINVCIYALLRGRTGRALAFLLLFLCFSFSYGAIRAGDLPASASSVSVALIQPNIRQELKWDPRARQYILDTYARLTEDASSAGPDLIVWPEAAFPGIVGEDEELFSVVSDFIDRLNTPVLLGAVTRESDRYYNSALLIDEQGDISQTYDKMHLVPFGEYIPLRSAFPFLQAVAPIGDIEAGKELSLFAIGDRGGLRDSAAGVLICFEDLFPDIAAAFVRRGAGLLINITNDAWYQQSPAAKQHLSASVLRAVENRRWLLRGTNTGVSGAIRPDGSIHAIIGAAQGREIFTEGMFFARVPAGALPQSLYTRYPCAFIVMLALLTAMMAIAQAVPCARRHQ